MRGRMNQSIGAMYRKIPGYIHIVYARKIYTKDGPVRILTLQGRDRTTYITAWCTTIISRAIDEITVEREERKEFRKKFYIKSVGSKISKSHPTYSYHDFRLIPYNYRFVQACSRHVLSTTVGALA